ncbi:MAG: ABC transporter permease, partial [Thermoanaerobaculia bacterium]
MMVSVAVMIGSFRRTVEAWVAQTVQSDLWIRPARGLSNADIATLPPEVVDDLRRVPEIAAIDRFRGTDVVWRDEIITVGSGEFDVAMEWGEIPMIEPRSHREALRRAIETGGVFVSETLSLEHDIGVGDRLELPTASGIETFPVAGIYRDYSNDRGVVIMDRGRWLETFRDPTSNTVAVFLREGVDAERARKKIEALVAAKYGAFVMTNATIRAEVMRIFDQTFLVTWALLAVALAVAVLGIVNTLTALILERRREIALLRVLGLDRRQIALMILLEAAVIGLVAALLGLVAGWILSWILIFVVNKQSFGWTIAFDPPFAVVLVSLAVTFAATVAAGLVPARLAHSVSMAGELKAE